MRPGSIKEFILPPGPVLGLTLIGLLLLSAVLYYRAIKVQRFLEPALAISQPRNEFARSINKLLLKEFGRADISGVRFEMGSILLEESLLFDKGNSMNIKKSAHVILNKLGHVFVSALSDENTRSHIELILISARFPISSDTGLSTKMRHTAQRMAESILISIYRAEPGLEKDYGTYFVATAMPVPSSEKKTRWVEFRIIPSELVHIELFQRLHKYVR